MTGPHGGVIGMDRNGITRIPERFAGPFEVGTGDVQMTAS